MSKYVPDYPILGSDEISFEQIFRLLPQPAVVITPSGRILYANAAFRSLVGLTSEAPASPELQSYFSPLPKELAGLAGIVCPVQLRGPEETTISFQLALQCFEPDSGLLWGTLVRQNAATLHQHKLESLGVLAGSVAHDLSNILTSVLGHVSFLRLSLAEQRSNDESLQAVEDGARRAASITQRILDFTRGQETSFCPVRLGDTAAAAVKLFRPSVPAGISLELDVIDPDVCVLGDEHQLGQVLMNLMVNARDALPSGGKIAIRIESLDVGPGASSVAFQLDPGRYAIIRISDTGPGIPDDVRRRIFEPFFTTKNQSGTGLGLAIVSSIVKVHQALIAVETSPDEGTTFLLFFPRCENAPEHSSRRDEEQIPGGSEQILVVDDEEAVRVIVQRSLEHLGYKVIVAKSGEEALSSFSREPEAFKLVIIDMIMPHMAGDELFHQLQRIHRSVPVLVASGYASDVRTRSILDHGGLGFIQKPFAVEELAREVRRCLDAAQTQPPFQKSAF